MEALLYFLLWGGLIFLMMRMGCGAHVAGRHKGHGGAAGDERGLRWVAPERDRDPVCNKVVRTAAAKPSVYDGQVYYFCSRDCREVFEAAPDLYGGAGGKVPPKQLERKHA